LPLLHLKVGMPMNEQSLKKSVILAFSEVSTQIKNSLILMTPIFDGLANPCRVDFGCQFYFWHGNHLLSVLAGV
jgi:hypothetical protein